MSSSNHRLGPALLCLSIGCGSGLQSAPSTFEVSDPQYLVATPPPAALAEVIPSVERSDLLWVDGTWHWSDGRWVWVRGGWAPAPAPGARYFPGRVLYGQDARIRYIPPTWLDEAGHRIPPPRIVIPAELPPAARSVEGLFR